MKNLLAHTYREKEHVQCEHRKKNGKIHKGQRLLSLIRLRYGSGNRKGSSSGSVVASFEISSRIICKRIGDSVQYQSNIESTFIKSVWCNTHALAHSPKHTYTHTHTRTQTASILHCVATNSRGDTQSSVAIGGVTPLKRKRNEPIVTTYSIVHTVVLLKIIPSLISISI